MEQLNFKNIKPQIKNSKYLELTCLVIPALQKHYQVNNPFILQYLLNKFNEQIYYNQGCNTYPRILSFLHYKIKCPFLSSDDYFLDRQNFNQITRQIFSLMELPLSRRTFQNLSSVVALNYHNNKKLTYKNLSGSFAIYKNIDLDHIKIYDQLILSAKDEIKKAA